ncbi:MAG: flippase-like domain-containing protein [Chloroflexi bacterium]|nr:flippase-like domain-containing protein [Chloroflexota bacterium]
MLLSVAFGIFVILVLGIKADLRSTLSVLVAFRWELLPLVLLLTCFNYAGRFLKWQFYLHRIASPAPVAASALIFLSGFSMVLTPGKIGELLKSYLLRQVNGTPLARSAPVVLAERLTDGLALLLLGSAGLLLYRRGWEVLLLILLIAVTIVVVVQSRPLSIALLSTLGHLPLISRVAAHLREAYESSYRLLQLDALLVGVGLGVLSWSGECLAFWVILRGLPFSSSASPLRLLIIAAFILASSTLVGSASLLPGGLGVADGGITGLLHFILGAPLDLSVAATLLIRFCTLWFGAVLGVLALAVFSQRFGAITNQPDSPGSVAGPRVGA